MSQHKKKGNRDTNIHNTILITALVNLITALINLISKLIE